MPSRRNQPIFCNICKLVPTIFLHYLKVNINVNCPTDGGYYKTWTQLWLLEHKQVPFRWRRG